MKGKSVVFSLVFGLVLLAVAGFVYYQFKDVKILKTPMAEEQKLILFSPAFEHQGYILPEYTCDGENINPPLGIKNVSPEAKSLVLIVDDPDAPMGTWVHWVIFNLNPLIDFIEPGKEPGGIVGLNSWGEAKYGGPCPPSGEHRYFFKLYALDKELDLGHGATKKDVVRTMEGHVLQSAELIGRYKR
ncbi:MAG: YbhB/YbcL family Raf kinase inhibitor-like protein [Patescibacteria group bacterium]